MARKKWKLSEEDYFTAKKYLQRALDDYRLAICDADDIDVKIAARNALNASKNAEQLQGWVDTYMSEKERKNMRSRLRVAKSRKNLHKKSVELPEDIYAKLQNWARDHGQTMSQAIDALVSKAEDERMRKQLRLDLE